MADYVGFGNLRQPYPLDEAEEASVRPEDPVHRIDRRTGEQIGGRAPSRSLVLQHAFRQAQHNVRVLEVHYVLELVENDHDTPAFHLGEPVGQAQQRGEVIFSEIPACGDGGRAG